MAHNNPSHILLARTPPTPSHPHPTIPRLPQDTAPNPVRLRAQFPRTISSNNQGGRIPSFGALNLTSGLEDETTAGQPSTLLPDGGAPSSKGKPGTTSQPTPTLSIHPTFIPGDDNTHPGTIQIVVEETTFYVHKDILVFTSPFFASLLTGGWMENQVDDDDDGGGDDVVEAGWEGLNFLDTDMTEQRGGDGSRSERDEDMNAKLGRKKGNKGNTKRRSRKLSAVNVRELIPPPTTKTSATSSSPSENDPATCERRPSCVSDDISTIEEDSFQTRSALPGTSPPTTEPTEFPTVTPLSDSPTTAPAHEMTADPPAIPQIGEEEATDCDLPTSGSGRTSLVLEPDGYSEIGVDIELHSSSDESDRDERVASRSKGMREGDLGRGGRALRKGRNSEGFKVDAKIYLREEKASAFHDLLHFAYPHLVCTVSWNNVTELMDMSEKFDIPLLKRQCTSFLISSAAGKPIQAMKIAEMHQIPPLYKEASRFVLDNWPNWDQEELVVLSETTLLKLEKRRSWFLERLLKLGLINSSKDYVCCPSCPDSQACAKALDEKWKSGWTACFKHGPPQPSMIYRHLRLLEPAITSPALQLPHTACQNHAKAWVADLFDRMFSLGTTRPGGMPSSFLTSTTRNWLWGGVSGGGGSWQSLGVGIGAGESTGGGKFARYFLYCEL